MNTTERVTRIIAEHIGGQPAAITPESTFGDLGCDSLDLIELGMECEDEFSIELADQEIAEVKTVADLVGLVDRIAALGA